MTSDGGAGLTRRRMSRTWRIVGYGIATGMGLAVLAGVLGATPRAGLAVFLLVSALVTATASLYAIGTLLIDDLRNRTTERPRIYQAFGLFVAAAALMAMLVGVGG